MWHIKNIDEISKLLDTDITRGLSDKALEQKRSQLQKNEIKGEKPPNLIIQFLSQFADFMVLILIGAAVISFIVSYITKEHNYNDCIIILTILIINAIVGVIEEQKAQKALDALKKMSAPTVTVIRDGKSSIIDAFDVYPGDVFLINAGDIVCADARIISMSDLYIDESMLTGESVPVLKDITNTPAEKSALSDRHNMVYSGSIVTRGHATCLCVATGMDCEMGKIASLMDTSKQLTPLQIKLNKTGKTLGILAVCVCVIIFLLGVLKKIDTFEMFMTSVSLAVAAIPEGLVAIVTVILSLGVSKMAKNGAIIRKLPAVETLGSANVICSDKTGTLTENKMTVQKILDVTKELDFSCTNAINILTLCALCNNATSTDGEPTEKALVAAAQKVTKPKAYLDNLFPRVLEISFTSERKLMTTVHKLGNNKYRVITKGALEYLLPNCGYYFANDTQTPINQPVIASIKNQNSLLAKDALRVLAVAYKDITYLPDKTEKFLETGLIYMGMLGIADPLRQGVRESVATCKKAGIKTVMITGDHIETAIAIGKKLGIYTKDGCAISGHEIDEMGEDNLTSRINDYTIFARVTPEHKVKIVRAFQAHDLVVCMTGDGVNDAPALMKSDIGCAMGKNGTAVAKSASDMILTDDNFSTIVKAVYEGRGIYENIKKAVHFLLSSNIGEVFCIFFAILFGMPTPLIAIQLLWVNLVTDSLPAISLAADKTDTDVMLSPPIQKRKSLFAGGLWFSIILEGFMIGALSLFAFSIGKNMFSSLVVGRTMSFCVLSISQLIHVYNVRTDHSVFEKRNYNPFLFFSVIICILLQISVVCIPSLNPLFKVCTLTFGQWVWVGILSFMPVPICELEKKLTKKMFE